MTDPNLADTLEDALRDELFRRLDPDAEELRSETHSGSRCVERLEEALGRMRPAHAAGTLPTTSVAT